MHKGRSCQLRKGRISQRQQIYHLRFSTHNRQRFTDFHQLCLVSRQINQTITDNDFKMLCWVLMPDHVHLLVQQLTDELSISLLVQRIKRNCSVHLNECYGTRQWWLRGYFDRAVRHDQSVEETARYIIGNPIRAKLVTRVEDYSFWNAEWL